jgi:hypothetical protein
MRRKTVLLCSLLLLYQILTAQCPPTPVFPTCNGTEPLVSAGETIPAGQTRYFYGAPATLPNVRLAGGRLVICSSTATFDNITIDSGEVFVHFGAAMVVTNGAGLVLRGNTAIYNMGQFQCLGNIVMDGTYATAAKPNIIINGKSNAWFRMPNQYFVINNPHSWFVNKGIADFHGLITDPLASTGSVCLGLNSQTRMRVLYNRARHPYISPLGPSCVYVELYSQFYDTLTVYPSIQVCLGAGHNSDASCMPWGCRPNAWGGAMVTTNCASCNHVLTFLSTGPLPRPATLPQRPASQPYPNPFSDRVVIPWTLTAEDRLEVQDGLGRRVHHIIESGRHDFSLRLPGAPAGMYLLRIRNRTEERVYKLLKQ